MRAFTSKCLQNALSEDDVVNSAREFVAGWHPDDLKRLPEHCRPGKLHDAADIGDLAYTLTRERFRATTDDEGSRLLEEMQSFFSGACERIGRLNAYRHGRLLPRSTARV